MTTCGGGDGDDDDDLFLAAVKDATPLARRAPRVTLAPRARTGPAAAKSRRPRFDVELDAERVEGRASGVSRKQLAPLRAGQLAIDGRVDLHGLTAAAAADVVRGRVAAAAQEGKRCLLIIHGRGQHSHGEPVLQAAVVARLTTGETAALVRGFCSALPRDGGPGALYVLLKRALPPPLTRR